MKNAKLIIAALFTLGIGLMSFAQDEGTSSEPNECMRYKAIAGNAYKVKEYEKVTWAYVKALHECGSLGMAFYKPFIYAIQKSMSDAPDEATQAAYLDTLIMIYESAQKEHGVQNEWQNNIAYSYLKQGAPSAMQKADSAYRIGIHSEGPKVNKGYLQQYYQNLYNLWVQEQDKKAKTEYKKRLISEYFTLSDYINKGEMGTDILDFLNSYFNNAVTDCESILPEITTFMNNLPQDLESKKATVKNFMALLEKKGCTKSKQYETLVDTIIAIDPTIDAVIAKAKLQLSKGNNSAAIKTFNEAISMSKSADEKSDIQLQIAKVLYNQRDYRSAHDAGIAISGKNAAEGYEIAAKCVNALMNDCGVSTLDRKANNYYAVELAEKSGNSSLVEKFKKECPNNSDIFGASKAEGDSITLNCWGKTYPLKVY